MIRAILAALVLVLSGVAAPAAHAGEMCVDGWMMRMRNADFEENWDGTNRVPGWCAEGPMTAGVDFDGRWAHSGMRNSFLQTGTAQWNGLVQLISLPRDNNYCIELIAYYRTMGPVGQVEFGMRAGRTTTVHAKKLFPASDGVYRLASVQFRPGTLAEGVVFIGHKSPNAWTRLMVDDLFLFPRYSTAPCV